MLVERNCPASRRPAVGLILRALAVMAEPAEIAVAPRFEEKGVDLLADHAGVGPGLISRLQGTILRTSQFAKPILQIDPHRQIEILAFVPNLDAFPAELAETRNLLPQRPGDRSD